MRFAPCFLLFVCLLSACGAAAPAPAAGTPAAAATAPAPTGRPAAPISAPATAIPTPPPAANPPSAATAQPDDTDPGALPRPEDVASAGDPPADQPDDSDPGLLPPLFPAEPKDFFPAGPQHVVWQGLRISYDPQSAVFALASPASMNSGARALAAAYLADPVDRCRSPWLGSDCFNAITSFGLYQKQRLGLREWLAGPGNSLDWWSPALDPVFETTVGGRPALGWSADGILAGVMTYLVDTGDTVMVISQVWDEEFLQTLSFPVSESDLPDGSFAMVRADRTAELWAGPSGGERVSERPLLYPGAFATILDWQGEAARVRTVDNVIGWVRGANVALTPAVTTVAPQTDFLAAPGDQGRVVHANSIPLRELPISTAPLLGEPVAPGADITIRGVSGDWLHMFIQDGPGNGRTGWMRWHYDGTRYVEPIR